MNQGSKGVLSWLWTFASPHKGGYAASLAFATLGVASAMAPYFCVSQIVLALLRGETSLRFYGLYCLLAAGFWALRYLFHAVSTSLSHKATFAVSV